MATPGRPKGGAPGISGRGKWETNLEKLKKGRSEISGQRIERLRIAGCPGERSITVRAETFSLAGRRDIHCRSTD